MPRTAALASPAREDEETTTHVDELIQRGRSQGHLSLPELREAFDQARVSPTEARSIIRELTEAGVQLANESTEAVTADAEPAGPAAAEQAAVSTAPETDLDDQTSVMGDSVHTYLKSIGRRNLLTAAEEVD